MELLIAVVRQSATDEELVIMPRMGALIFREVGRQQVEGVLADIAGVGCGFTANLLIVTTAVLLAGISTEPAAAVHPPLPAR